MADRCYESSAPQMRMMSNQAYGRGGKMHGSLSQVAYNVPNRISSLNNFLEQPAIITQISGKVSLEFVVPKSYSHFQVVLFTDSSSIMKNFDISTC